MSFTRCGALESASGTDEYICAVAMRRLHELTHSPWSPCLGVYSPHLALRLRTAASRPYRPLWSRRSTQTSAFSGAVVPVVIDRPQTIYSSVLCHRLRCSCSESSVSPFRTLFGPVPLLDGRSPGGGPDVLRYHAQLLQFLLQPNSKMAAVIAAVKSKLQWPAEGTPVLGLHIRRGASKHPLPRALFPRRPFALLL